jgi:hypothetical protein
VKRAQTIDMISSSPGSLPLTDVHDGTPIA